jgi:putative transposase
MPNFIRAILPGGTFFFTVVTFERRPMFRDPAARRILREVVEDVRSRRPFEIDGLVLLPDHLHTIWTLPPDDHDFSTLWRKIKEHFTRRHLGIGGPEAPPPTGGRRKGLRGVWQQRFWEHTIRDERDFERHMDYIHYNPVKHGHATCPHAWVWSSFQRWVREGVYAPDWCCECEGRVTKKPTFADLAPTAWE